MVVLTGWDILGEGEYGKDIVRRLLKASKRKSVKVRLSDAAGK